VVEGLTPQKANSSDSQEKLPTLSILLAAVLATRARARAEDHDAYCGDIIGAVSA